MWILCFDLVYVINYVYLSVLCLLCAGQTSELIFHFQEKLLQMMGSRLAPEVVVVVLNINVISNILLQWLPIVHKFRDFL